MRASVVGPAKLRFLSSFWKIQAGEGPVMLSRQVVISACGFLFYGVRAAVIGFAVYGDLNPPFLIRVTEINPFKPLV
jgi:hypothetical protein